MYIQGQYLDIIGFNRYNSWYSNTGRLEVIREKVEDEAYKWHTKYNKPVFMAEYGADTIPGLHIVSIHSSKYIYIEYYSFIKKFNRYNPLSLTDVVFSLK